MRLALLVMLCLALLLAACEAAPVPDNPQTGATTADGNDNAGDLIRWERDPFNIVFQARVTGGDDADAIYRLNAIPPCTLYGDGRVVWPITDERGDTQVLFDFADYNAIEAFVSRLTVQYRFYTYEALADLQLPSSQKPVVEELALNVNERQHITDGFADWPPDFFAQVVSECIDMAQTPTLYEPEGAWLVTREVSYNPRVPSVIWDDEAAGLSLEPLNEPTEDGQFSRQWIEGQNVRILWNVIHSTGLDTQMVERGTEYQIALQVPGITIDAPPPPAPADLAREDET